MSLAWKHFTTVLNVFSSHLLSFTPEGSRQICSLKSLRCFIDDRVKFWDHVNWKWNFLRFQQSQSLATGPQICREKPANSNSYMELLALIIIFILMGQTVLSAAYQFLNQQISLKGISLKSKAGLWEQRILQVGRELHTSLSQTSSLKFSCEVRPRV